MKYFSIVVLSLGMIFVPLAELSAQETIEDQLARCRDLGLIIVEQFDTEETIDLQSLWGGYCDHYGRWSQGIVTRWTIQNAPPNIDENGSPIIWVGNATWYEEGKMEQQEAYSGRSLEGYFDGIAVMFCPPNTEPFVYERAWIRRNESDPWVLVRPIDCSGIEDVLTPIDQHNGVIIELGYKTAVAWGMIEIRADGTRKIIQSRMDNVQVYFGETPPTENVVYQNYAEWWRRMARFETVNGTVSYGEIREMNPQPWPNSN